MKRVFFSALLVVFVTPFFAAAEALEEDVVLEVAETILEETVDEHEEVVRITVRTQEGIVAQNTLALATTTDSLLLTPTSGGEPEEVDPRSVLALLVALDALSDTFTITDLQYYGSFGAFFLNCIEVSEELCGNWQYTVNGVYPGIGMDSYILADNDEVYVFYGSPRIVTLATTTVFVDEPFTALLTQYDPVLGEYVPLEGFTLGVVMEDPNNPWTPIEVLTAPTDVTGSAIFTVATSGEYAVGIKEDSYYPRTSVSVILSETVVSPALDDETSEGSIVGGGGGGMLIGPTRFDVAGACAFIAQQQGTDGSFSAPLYTDWAGIALAVCDGEAEARRAVRSYLLTNADPYERVTDYERRAMVLMALGIDPYTGTDTDLIDGITASFDGSQIGDPDYINDDIFALVVFARAAPAEDDVLFTVLAHVLSVQRSEGSWPGGVDMTAAAIQALTPFSDAPGVREALAVAVGYLRSQQGSDGGFGNVFSTAWVLQALAALGKSPSEWSMSGADPYTYLVRAQQADGGVEAGGSTEDRLWATSYAVLGAAGQTWYDVMQPFTLTDIRASRSTSAPAGTVAGTADTTESEYEEDVQQATDVASSVGGSLDEGLPIEAIRALIAYADSLREPASAPSSVTSDTTAYVSEASAPAEAEARIVAPESIEPTPSLEEEATDDTAAPTETTPTEGGSTATYVLIGVVSFLLGLLGGRLLGRNNTSA
jgi:hypothetical protein